MAKSLLREVSLSELEHMRSDGMTNRQIADSLDVSYMTVFRALGPQPREMTARSRGGTDGVNFSKKEPGLKRSKEERPAALLVESRTLRLVGQVFGYQVEMGQEVTVSVMEEEETRITLKIEELDALIAELTAISLKAANLKNTLEAW